VYNIGGEQYHTIEELSDLVIKATGADPSLAEYKDTETLTTRLKRVDTAKARRDLDHRDAVTLEEGVRLTVAWMRQIYGL
jgi:dTDP-glucose 4,6-dehydratase